MNKEYLENIDRIFISFSGGKTSAYMAKKVIEKYRKTHEIKVLFANTGQEHEKTLEFVDRCDKEFDLDVTWIESNVQHGQRLSSQGVKVDFETACRDGRLFEEMVKKYGISNFAFPHCTRELKTSPMHNYVKKVLGWKKGTYATVIGIRADEIDRINAKFKELKYWYPLADWGITKQCVNNFWKKQPFNLEIPEHLGNCTWCWKKTLKKQMAVIRDMPEAHKVPMQIEEKYKVFRKGDKVLENQVFFRKNKSARDLYEIYESGTVESFVDEQFNDCKESCEPF